MADNPFEIPQTMRDMAENNMKQAHAAYDQLADFVTKAMGTWMGAMPANPMTAGFKDLQDRAVTMAKQNADIAFAQVEKLAKAQNFQDILTLQNSLCSRPDAGLHRADAGASQADWRSRPEVRPGLNTVTRGTG